MTLRAARASTLILTFVFGGVVLLLGESQHERPMAINFEGTERLNGPAIEARLHKHGVNLRLDRPLDTLTICVVKEVIADLMAEKGFADANVTYREMVTGTGLDARVKVAFDIKDGPRSRRVSSKGIAARPTPQTRCSR
jgi:hypothetical protein